MKRSAQQRSLQSPFAAHYSLHRRAYDTLMERHAIPDGGDTIVLPLHKLPRVDAMLTQQYFTPIDVRITLEHTGQWPDAVQAVRRLKAAIYTALARALREQFELIACAHEWILHVSIVSIK